jgi:hypothetical protein
MVTYVLVEHKYEPKINKLRKTLENMLHAFVYINAPPYTLYLSDITVIFFIVRSLTHSVRAEYIYSVASQATSPDGVYILRDFHKVVK